ncbi:MAG: hypothetical protein OXC93_01020, partial [Rhodospirillaceae bacterium]|nr:hypothetical protein [Rhodospirillaceae bacterium]
ISERRGSVAGDVGAPLPALAQTKAWTQNLMGELQVWNCLVGESWFPMNSDDGGIQLVASASQGPFRIWHKTGTVENRQESVPFEVGQYSWHQHGKGMAAWIQST